MSKEKKPSGSKLKIEPQTEETTIGSTMPVQIVSDNKEIKAALPMLFTGDSFKNNQMKELFLLFYMKDRPELLANEDPTKAPK
uniref:Reverse transcriptase-rnase h-integrase n=1 Tax=Moniliophthora roreri TaxID=221103 RepID=A0A0W0FHZ7_MONRR